MADSRNPTVKKYGRKRKFVPDLTDETSDARPAKKHSSSSSDSEKSFVEETNVVVIADQQPPKTSKRQPLASIGTAVEINSSSSDEYEVSYSGSVPSDFSSPMIGEAKSAVVAGDQTPQDRKGTGKRAACDDEEAEPARKYRKIPCCVTRSLDQRVCTLPRINFADADDVWRLMCRQDEKVSLQRDPNMFQMHKGLHLRMRAILLDWLAEVSEVYKLRRETFYLAVDYFDRYLTNVIDCVPKNQLQLIGVTCLFIAAKVEEIYPPKISEFAYVTDGACSEEDILKQELAILATLQWNMNPVTVIGWISLYMQINVTSNLKVPASGLEPEATGRNRRKSMADRLIAESKKAEAFVYPQFSALQYTQVAQLTDLCLLDVEMGSFPYSVIAAAAISHVFDKKTATQLSGLDWDSIAPCARWIEPFHEAIKQKADPIFLSEQDDSVNFASGLQHLCANIKSDESHTIQTHSTSVQMFEQALEKRSEMEAQKMLLKSHEKSPAPTGSSTRAPEGLLTPPASNRKSLEAPDLDKKSSSATAKVRF